MIRMQKNVVFVVFLLILTVSVIVQSILIYHWVTQKLDFENYFLPLFTASGSIMASIGLFFTMIKKEFLDKKFLTQQDLKEYFILRAFSIEMATEVKEYYFCADKLILNSLRFAEKILRKQYGNELKFEISLFTNRINPQIKYYYNSTGFSIPSSNSARQANPNYYLEKQYAVVELLKNPPNDVCIKSETSKDNYSFVTEEQKRRIKSQAMFCICNQKPYVLVITCSKKNIFKENDTDFIQFIEAIGNCIKADIEMKNILSNEN